MPDIEAPEPDAVEQEQTRSDAAAPATPSVDAEVPEGDSLEQAEPVQGGATVTPPADRPLDANEADVQEQLLEAPVEEDDYGR
jgi:hypothetical protein